MTVMKVEVSTVTIEKRMGKSPVRGYRVWEDKHSFLLGEVFTSAWGRETVRVPKDRDDALRMVSLIIGRTHGPLAAQAILANIKEDGK